MFQVSSFKFQERGVGIVEIIIAVFIISTAFFAILQLSVMTMKAAGERNNKERALQLAQEGIEASRAIRDSGWTANIAGLSFGSTYYPVNNSAAWALAPSNPPFIYC